MPSFHPKRFDDVALLPNGLDTAFGVPDTNISGLLTYLSATKPRSQHIVTANEGAAVALAAGYHLATGRVALVYMQNSGLANALNPLQSIAAKEVFGIPMLLLIGWHGRSGAEEELQDALVGPRLIGNLQTNDIPLEEMPDCIQRAKETISGLVAKAVEQKTPVALLVTKGAFLDYEVTEEPQLLSSIAVSNPVIQQWASWPSTQLPLSREDAIRCLINQMEARDLSVSSLGGNSRELYMIRKEKNQPVSRNFFCIGAMGHVYALSYGVSMGFTSGRIFCIDGEGSFFMHTGNIALLAGISPPNLVHVVIYNGVYASTGNHPVMVRRENLISLARGLPYEQKYFVDDLEGLRRACVAATKSTLIIVAVDEIAKQNLPAPSETLHELKKLFVRSML